MISTRYSKIILLLFFIIAGTILDSCSSARKSSDGKHTLLLGKVEIKGADSKDINEQKFDVALNLTAKLSRKYRAIPFEIWDTLSQNNLTKKSPSELAEEAGVDYLVFGQVNVIKNIIRTQIVLTDVNSPDVKKTGTGYSELNYISSNTGELIYDPSLLKSMQRAFALAVNDSNLFYNDSLGIKIKPLPTMVIGSIAFVNEGFSEWNLYLDKVVNSYAAVETVFDVLKKEDKYVMYDTETRDSVYNIFGFNIVENYTPPSTNEINVLYRFGVDYYTAGTLTRTEEGAEIELGLYTIGNGKIYLVKSEKEKFTDDSRMVFLEHLSRAAKRLFDIKQD